MSGASRLLTLAPRACCGSGELANGSGDSWRIVYGFFMSPGLVLGITFLTSAPGLGELANGSGDSWRLLCVCFFVSPAPILGTSSFLVWGPALGELAKGSGGPSSQFGLRRRGGVGLFGSGLANGSELSCGAGTGALPAGLARCCNSILPDAGGLGSAGDLGRVTEPGWPVLPHRSHILAAAVEGDMRLRLFPALSTRIGSFRSPVVSKSSDRNRLASARDGFTNAPPALAAGRRFASAAPVPAGGAKKSRSPVVSNSSERPSKFTPAESPVRSARSRSLYRVVRATGSSVGEGPGGGLDEMRSITSLAIVQTPIHRIGPSPNGAASMRIYANITLKATRLLPGIRGKRRVVT